MKKTILTAVALAIPLMAGIPMTKAADEAIGPGQVRASKIIGSSVYDVNNQKIGSVQDLVLNKDGRAVVAVVDVGSFLGIGGKDVAISLNEIKADNNRLTLDRSKQTIAERTELSAR
jgi:sporulation protein YlmC with PRC-barrel domain